ncbi:MAG TPA: energy transducer TonB [Bacteroidales bacterium]|nr:energy transducer TonB [Bacteroidales bacterium]
MRFKTKNTEFTPGADNKSFRISDFDDLVFEHKNRDYGAYQLRKRYNRAVITGTIIASLLAVAVILIPFLARPSSERIISGGGGYIQVRMDRLQPPPEEIYVPPAPPPPAASKMPETVEYVAPVIVDSIVPADQTQMITDAALASSDSDIIDVTAGSGFGDDLLSGADGSGNEEPLFIVEVMPTFKGGDLNKFRDWVGQRTRYPEEAITNKIRGTVFLTFIVEKDGSVSNVTVIKGVHPMLDDEAVRAISESPKWSPGLQRGQPVRVRFQIPLSFTY